MSASHIFFPETKPKQNLVQFNKGRGKVYGTIINLPFS